MVTLIKMYPADPIEKDGVLRSRAVFIFAGLPNDDRPEGTYNEALIANGSKFYSIGGAAYTYDEQNDTWVQDAGGSGSGSGGGVSDDLATQILQLITLATGSTPVTRVVVEDEADTTIECDAWDKEYVVPGTSLESLTIELPATTPTALSSCIKVTILSTTRHADPEDESEDPLLLPPTIILPDGLYIIGGYPEFDGDRWCLTIDNNLTATAMVIPAPVQTEGETSGETEGEP